MLKVAATSQKTSEAMVTNFQNATELRSSRVELCVKSFSKNIHNMHWRTPWYCLVLIKLLPNVLQLYYKRDYKTNGSLLILQKL